MKFRYELQKRLWKKVNIGKLDECWKWNQYTDRDGYGTFYFDGQSAKAHRYVYELYNGPILKGHCICHICDNPSCLNPTHLFMGTHLENMNDMKQKKRSRNSLGELNTNTCLSESEIIYVFDLVLNNKIHFKQEIIEINPKFSYNIIKNILDGRNWKDTTSKYTKYEWEFIKDTLAGYITRSDVEKIKYDMIVNKKTNIEIEQDYGITRWTASKIRNNKHKYS